MPLAFFFVTQWLATGSWKPFYADYGTDKYKYVVDGVPSYWMHPAGLDANHESPLVYLFHCTLGHHGILSLSPIFLFALAAWLVPRLVARLESAAHPLGLGGHHRRRAGVLFDADRELQLRRQHVRPALDLLADSAVAGLDDPRARRGGHTPGRPRASRSCCLAVSTFSAWYPIENPWQHPWLFQAMEHWHWIDYRHPIDNFTRPVVTFFPLLPEHDGEWIDFAGIDPNGRPLRLRLADRGSETRDGRTLRRIAAIWNPAPKRSERSPS